MYWIFIWEILTEFKNSFLRNVQMYKYERLYIFAKKDYIKEGFKCALLNVCFSHHMCSYKHFSFMVKIRFSFKGQINCVCVHKNIP